VLLNCFKALDSNNETKTHVRDLNFGKSARRAKNKGNSYSSKNYIFWDVTPCSLLKVYRRIGGTLPSHLGNLPGIQKLWENGIMRNN
jgi:hypothetical protein